MGASLQSKAHLFFLRLHLILNTALFLYCSIITLLFSFKNFRFIQKNVKTLYALSHAISECRTLYAFSHVVSISILQCDCHFKSSQHLTSCYSRKRSSQTNWLQHQSATSSKWCMVITFTQTGAAVLMLTTSATCPT